MITTSGEFRMGYLHYELSGYSQNVLAAGTLQVKDGYITTVNRASGHFKPSSSEMTGYRELLGAFGFDMSRASIVDNYIELR